VVNAFWRNGKNIISSRQSDILSAAAVIMVMVAVSALLGFVRDRLLIAAFFTGLAWQTDVYFAAFNITDLVFQLLVLGALSAAFIPVYSDLLSGGDEEQARRTAGQIFNLALTAFLVLGGAIFFLARPLSSLVAPGFSPIQTQLMVRVVRIMLTAQGLFIVSSIFTGVLQSHHRFLLPALAPVLYNLAIIFGIVFLVPWVGIYGPVVGVVAGALLHAGIQLPLAFKLGLRPGGGLGFRNPYVFTVVRLMIPRTLALAVGHIETTVAVVLASTLGMKAVTLFAFSQHLVNVVVRLFGSSFGQASLPTLSVEAAKADRSRFSLTFLSVFQKILYLSVPAAALLLILRLPIVRIVYGVREFTWQDTLRTAWAVALFSPVVVVQSLNQLLVRGFYALKDTKTPLYVALAAVVVDVVLSVFLTRYWRWGIAGLTAAASLSGALQSGLLLIWLDRRVGGFPKARLLSPAFKIGAAGMAMAVFLWLPMRLLDRLIFDTTRVLPLVALTLVAATVGVTIYILLTWALEVEERKDFVSLLSRVGNWRRVLAQTEEVIETGKD
jgi:putative peptidoglycan lipid II flippase